MEDEPIEEFFTNLYIIGKINEVEQDHQRFRDL